MAFRKRSSIPGDASVQNTEVVNSNSLEVPQTSDEALDSFPEIPVYDRLDWPVWIFGFIMAVLGFVTVVLMLQNFRSESYLYLAFYSIPSNAAISIFPHEPIIIYFGKIANIWLAALAATLGTIVAGYMDYRVFVPVLNLRNLQSYRKKALYRTAISAFMRYPFFTLIVVGFTPIPFFPFKFLTFSIHYPLTRYLSALVLGRFPRYLLLGWVGAAFQIPNWILFGSFLIIIALYAVKAWQKAMARPCRK